MRNLTAIQVERLNKIGRYADGAGLYLHIDTSGKRWFFRYTEPFGDKRRAKISLGTYDKKTNTLADARESASDMRRLVRNGIDPKQDRDRRKAEREHLKKEHERAVVQQALTFEFVSREWFDSRKDQWRNSKHRQQNINTLTDYVFPHIGDIPIKDVRLKHIRICLDPIWRTKTETA